MASTHGTRGLLELPEEDLTHHHCLLYSHLVIGHEKLIYFKTRNSEKKLTKTEFPQSSHLSLSLILAVCCSAVSIALCSSATFAWRRSKGRERGIWAGMSGRRAVEGPARERISPSVSGTVLEKKFQSALIINLSYLSAKQAE